MTETEQQRAAREAAEALLAAKRVQWDADFVNILGDGQAALDKHDPRKSTE